MSKNVYEDQLLLEEVLYQRYSLSHTHKNLFFFCSFGCDYISEVDWVRPLVVCFFPPVYDGLMVCFELVNWKAAGDIV